MLSASNDRDTVTRALDLGAVGFIPKPTQRAVMLSGLELTLSGGIYIPPKILAPHVSPGDLGMTERKGEVLALLMQGKSNKAICRVLHLCEPRTTWARF